MIKYLLNLHLQNRSVRELSRLTDRELADVGIARVDIKAVARFAADMSRDDVEALLDPALPRSGDHSFAEPGRLAFQA